MQIGEALDKLKVSRIRFFLPDVTPDTLRSALVVHCEV